jgi:hypothetical protein
MATTKRKLERHTYLTKEPSNTHRIDNQESDSNKEKEEIDYSREVDIREVYGEIEKSMRDKEVKKKMENDNCDLKPTHSSNGSNQLNVASSSDANSDKLNSYYMTVGIVNHSHNKWRHILNLKKYGFAIHNPGSHIDSVRAYGSTFLRPSFVLKVTLRQSAVDFMKRMPPFTFDKPEEFFTFLADHMEPKRIDKIREIVKQKIGEYETNQKSQEALNIMINNISTTTKPLNTTTSSAKIDLPNELKQGRLSQQNMNSIKI